MKIKTEVLLEAGFTQAMIGLSLNKKQPVEAMPGVADKLAHRDGGHNKFLEHMMVWVNITAPRFWWQEFDTYRVGVSKQSESTMHTIISDGELTHKHFDADISLHQLEYLNYLIKQDELVKVKQQIPEGFLQKREVILSYKVLRHIKKQRTNHTLPHWNKFLMDLKAQLKFPNFIWKD